MTQFYDEGSGYAVEMDIVCTIEYHELGLLNDSVDLG